MKFLGREQELNLLEGLFREEAFQSVLIYGRRRIGKSELIKQAIRNMKDSEIKIVYLECKQTTELDNAEQLSELTGSVLGFPPPQVKSFEHALNLIVEESKQQPIILVLDEYPYLTKLVKGMDSIVQALIDMNRHESKMKLVLCGSSMDTMENLLETHNPLYGPMDYYESSLFYANYSEEDKVRMYSCLGGIPYYNSLVDSTKSVKENIIHLITAPNSRMENEINLYLRNEISKVENTNAVFEAIAAGSHKFNDIQSKAHIRSAQTLVDILDKLIHMELVEKETPINAEDNRKRANYVISDHLSRFYYTYVSRHLSERNLMSESRFYQEFVEKDFEEKFVPRVFEQVAKQYLTRLNRADRLDPFITKLGKYYYDDPVNHKNGEFDVVTEDKNGYIFYEVKFTKHPLTQAVIDEEIAQVEACGLKSYRYGFISRSGFEKLKKNDYILIELKDMFRI